MAWTNGNYQDTTQQPLHVNHNSCSLQLFRRGYHRLISRHYEGYCNYTKVLCGRLVIIIPDIDYETCFISRKNLYEKWLSLLPPMDLEDEHYKKYMKGPFKAIVLGPGHYM
jgi:hypothetical protein